MVLKCYKAMRELSKMFLNLDDSVNFPQYPGYQGYQLLEALPVGQICSALTDQFIFHKLFCIDCFVINYFSGVKYVQM